MGAVGCLHYAIYPVDYRNCALPVGQNKTRNMAQNTTVGCSVMWDTPSTFKAVSAFSSLHRSAVRQEWNLGLDPMPNAKATV